MVVIACPAMATPRVRQESCGMPSTNTVQHPHSPSSQPCLVPVSPRSSRTTSKSVLWGANETSIGSLFTVRRIWAFSGLILLFLTCFTTLILLSGVPTGEASARVILARQAADGVGPYGHANIVLVGDLSSVLPHGG